MRIFLDCARICSYCGVEGVPRLALQLENQCIGGLDHKAKQDWCLVRSSVNLEQQNNSRESKIQLDL